MPPLNEREITTVLAALRYFQANRDDVIELGMPHFDDGCEPLTCDEIDELCERINCHETQE